MNRVLIISLMTNQLTSTSSIELSHFLFFCLFSCSLSLCLFSPDVNYEELARCTDDFNGAQCKAVCVEAVSTAFYLFNYLFI